MLTPDQINELAEMTGKQAYERTILGARQANERDEMLARQADEGRALMEKMGQTVGSPPEFVGPGDYGSSLPDIPPGAVVQMVPSGTGVSPPPSTTPIPRPLRLRK